MENIIQYIYTKIDISPIATFGSHQPIAKSVNCILYVIVIKSNGSNLQSGDVKSLLGRSLARAKATHYTGALADAARAAGRYVRAYKDVSRTKTGAI